MHDGITFSVDLVDALVLKPGHCIERRQAQFDGGRDDEMDI